MEQVLVNGLFRRHTLTGVQRYASEITQRWLDWQLPIRVLDPPQSLASTAALHLWEQTLPGFKHRSGLLWSPANSGPLLYKENAVTVHDGAVLSNPEWFSPQYAAWKRFLLPRLIINARAVLTVSDFSKSHLVRWTGVDATNVHVVPNGVDHSFFAPQRNDIARSRLSLLGVDGPYVLCVGSLDIRKNLPRLLRAWEIASVSNVGEHQLVVVGGSPSSLRRMALRSTNSVLHLGYVDDQFLPALYSEATAFAFPSIFEGFGLPVLEAMACGTAVITSRGTPMAEIGGDAVMLVDPFDVEEMANALTTVVGNSELRSRLSAEGLEVASTYTWERSARETWDVIRSLV